MRALFFAASLLWALPVRAQSPRAELTPQRRAVAAGAAIVPGVLVHGAGHFVARQPKTGRALLIVGSGGLALTGGSLVGLAMTGASRRTVAAFATGMVFGVGAFSLSTLADLYGVAMPERWRGRAPSVQPWFTAESGVLYRYDRQFDGRILLHQSVDALLARRHHLRLDFDSMPGDPSSRTRALYGFRVFTGAHDNTHVAVEIAGLHQRYPIDGFFTSTLEIALSGRVDLARIGPTLRGSFVEARIGGGLSALATSRVSDDDSDELLLLRWGFGAYLGKGRGEVLAYYEHRRDTYAGGLLLARGGGYAGFLGGRAHYFLTPQLGVGADVQVGSAVIGGLSLLIRQGASP